MNTMKKLFTFLIALAVLTNTHQLSAQVMCDNDSLGWIPIQDLGTGYYGIFQGGLYQGGTNNPPTSHLNKGIAIAKKLKPLDTLGNVNYATGKIVLAGFGASTVGGPFNHMIQIMKSETGLNPCMKAVNAANGSDGLEELTIENEEFWDYIKVFKLAEKGLTPIQVQVGWLMHSSRIDSNSVETEAYIDSLVKRFTIAVQAMTYYYPNLKILYVSGFPYGGYADPTKVLYHVIAEPASYNHNFAVKKLIQNQINGSPDLRYKTPGKVAPYLIWGPPIWADGKNPNLDGLSWNCETEFAEDGGGYHMTNLGKDKLGDILLDFFETDTLSKGWFLDGPKWTSCATGRNADGSIIVPKDEIINKEDVTIYPNPSSGEFYVDFDAVLTTGIQVKVLNNLGEIIYADNYNSVTPYSGYSFNITGKPTGIYYFEVVINNKIYTQPIILNK